MEIGERCVILLFKSSRFEGNLYFLSGGNVFWPKQKQMKEYALAQDMGEMMKLFDSKELKEFYYVPNGSCQPL